MSDKNWMVARKRPVEVSFRSVDSEGETIETREGTLKAYPEQDYIIKGVDGEEYPIKKDIFTRTYDVLDEEESKRFPVVIEDEAVLKLIRRARALEWIANHQFGRYHKVMNEVWDILRELHDLDSENHVYTLASEIPTIYYLKKTIR